MSTVKLTTLLAVLSGLIYVDSSNACSVCYGAGGNNSPLFTALKISVLSLLAILLGVLGSFMWFFVQMAKRSKDIRITK